MNDLLKQLRQPCYAGDCLELRHNAANRIEECEALHVCNFTDDPEIRHTFEGKVCFFDFSKRFGPLFLRADGEPKKIQPIDPNCWHYRAFSDWYTARKTVSEKLSGS